MSNKSGNKNNLPNTNYGFNMKFTVWSNEILKLRSKRIGNSLVSLVGKCRECRTDASAISNNRPWDSRSGKRVRITQKTESVSTGETVGDEKEWLTRGRSWKTARRRSMRIGKVATAVYHGSRLVIRIPGIPGVVAVGAAGTQSLTGYSLRSPSLASFRLLVSLTLDLPNRMARSRGPGPRN